MDLERMDWSERAERMTQELSLLGVTVAADPAGEPCDCSGVWKMPVPDWKMRIYHLIFYL